MSTSYYRLAEPLSSLRLEEGTGHDRVTIFENGANCGTLTFSRGMGKVFIANLSSDHDNPPLRTRWGGRDVGSVVDVFDDSLADDVVLISEYREVLTVAQIKARNGQKRADGFPTELLGYESQARS